MDRSQSFPTKKIKVDFFSHCTIKMRQRFYPKGIMFFFDSPCFDLTLGFQECEFYPRYYALVRERFIWVYVLIL